MPAKKKPFRYAVQATKRKKGKKKPQGYKPPPSPKDRCTPWVSVTVRAEHYAMLREIGDFYEAPVSKVVATLIVHKYCRLLREDEPVTAQKILEAYRDGEKHEGQLVDFEFAD